MTDPLDTLRPEVRDALDWFVARRHFGTNGDGHLKTIRAELLRLATIEADALITLDCEHDWQVEHERAEKAEAELAALKARIADSPIASLVYGQGDLLAVISAENPDDWAGKRVRLVVEE